MTRLAAWALIGILAFMLGGELLCRALPVSSATRTGYYFDPVILTYPGHHQWTTSNGWDLRNAQLLKSNNFGFVADHEFVRDENAVALVGDSFVEAGMLRAEERPAAQLERALGSRRPVYALGGPGSALLDYAERIRFAHEKFGVRDFVVFMERGDVVQSLCGSGNIHGPCLDRRTLQPRIETQPPAGFAKRVLRRSALAQYVFSQLKVTPGVLWRQAIAQSRPASASVLASDARSSGVEPPALRTGAMAEIDAVTHRFFQQIEGCVPGRLIIVLDSDRVRMRQGLPPAEDAAREHFLQLARSAGVDVVDTLPLFGAHYSSSSLRLEVGPSDGHLNRLGQSIAMHAAAESLIATP